MKIIASALVALSVLASISRQRLRREELLRPADPSALLTPQVGARAALSAALFTMEGSMKKLIGSSVFGLVAVPPAPDTSLSWRRGESAPTDGELAQKHVRRPNTKRRSLRALLTVAISAIALIGAAMVVISVRATSAPPATGWHTNH